MMYPHPKYSNWDGFVSFCVIVRTCSGSAVGINPSSKWKSTKWSDASAFETEATTTIPRTAPNDAFTTIMCTKETARWCTMFWSMNACMRTLPSWWVCTISTWRDEDEMEVLAELWKRIRCPPVLRTWASWKMNGTHWKCWTTRLKSMLRHRTRQMNSLQTVLRPTSFPFTRFAATSRFFITKENPKVPRNDQSKSSSAAFYQKQSTDLSTVLHSFPCCASFYQIWTRAGLTQAWRSEPTLSKIVAFQRPRHCWNCSGRLIDGRLWNYEG